MRFGVLYCCKEAGDLPVLTLELTDLPTGLPEQGNRFLIQVGSSLTLSSPSRNLAAWTKSVLHSASSFQVGFELLLLEIQDFKVVKMSGCLDINYVHYIVISLQAL